MKKGLKFIALVIGLFIGLNSVNAAQETFFEGTGNYGFAVAGNNNATRGLYYADGDNVNWITAKYSSNNITTTSWYRNLSRNYKITNISGSKLTTNNSKVKKAYLGYFAYNTDCGFSQTKDDEGHRARLSGEWKTGECDFRDSTHTNGRILLIRPDGKSYSIIPIENTFRGFIDITDYIDTNNPDGWYYVSFLNAGLAPQTVWGMTVVYEDSTLPVNYVKLIHADTTLTNGASESFKFNSQFTLKNKFQLSGMILAGGASAWFLDNTESNPTNINTTYDKAYAILSDNTEQQLYATQYNSKTVFAGRSNIDFVNDIFDTVRDHKETDLYDNNSTLTLKGGELDIFNETLSSDFFNGKEIIGYKFHKTGTNTIFPGLLGLTQEIETPNVNITTKISSDSSLIKSGDEVTVKTTVINAKDVCINSYNNIITTSVDTVLSDVKNIVVTKNGTKIDVKTSYDKENGIITLDEISVLNCDDKIVVSYDATVNDTITKDYKIDTTATVNYSAINLNNLSGDELTRYKAMKITKKATDSVSTKAVSNNNEGSQETKLVNPKTGVTSYTLMFVLIIAIAFTTYIIIRKKRKLIR